MTEYRSNPSRRLSLVAGSLIFAANALGGVDELVEAIAASEIRFARAESHAPFPAVGWAKYQHYSEAEFASFTGGVSPVKFRQQELNVGGVLPVYVGKRDLVMAGLDTGYDRFDFKSATFHNPQVLTLTPVVGWLRQLDTNSQIAAFAAPMFSSALGDESRWGTSGFAGLIGTYQANDHWMWIYGGVYENSFGSHYAYPYLGFNWLPDEHWAVAFIVPWPSVTYAPNTNCFLQLGVAPGGAEWRVRNNGEETVASFGSWNLSAGAGWRLTKNFWLRGQVGLAGLRSLQIAGNGHSRLDAEANPHPVFTLSFEFRP